MITTFSEYLNESLNSNFKKWFGKSKIKENNKPLICYHGSNNSDIQTFDVNNIGKNTGNYGHYGYGIYFSTDIREAQGYGKYIYECYLRVENPFTGTEDELVKLKENGIDIKVDEVVKSIDFDSFKNSFKKEPIIFNFISDFAKFGISKAWDNIRLSGEDYDSDKLNDISDIIKYTTIGKEQSSNVPDYILNLIDELEITPKFNKGLEYIQSLHWITDLGRNSKEVTDVIKKLGYDGVWYGSEVVLFEPNQIKSVKNNGGYSLKDLNIYK